MSVLESNSAFVESPVQRRRKGPGREGKRRKERRQEEKGREGRGRRGMKVTGGKECRRRRGNRDKGEKGEEEGREESLASHLLLPYNHIIYWQKLIYFPVTEPRNCSHQKLSNYFYYNHIILEKIKVE
jgi:hypothetical protein